MPSWLWGYSLFKILRVHCSKHEDYIVVKTLTPFANLTFMEVLGRDTTGQYKKQFHLLYIVMITVTPLYHIRDDDTWRNGQLPKGQLSKKSTFQTNPSVKTSTRASWSFHVWVVILTSWLFSKLTFCRLTISPTIILKDRTGDKRVKFDEGGRGSKTSPLIFLEGETVVFN